MSRNKQKKNPDSSEAAALDPRYFDRFHYAVRSLMDRGEAVDGADLESWEPANDLEKALVEVFHAYESEDPELRKAYTAAALAIDPDCPDALILQAELNAETPEEAYEMYSRARQSAENRIGPDRLKEIQGDIWPSVEARPLLRAMSGQAQAGADLGKIRESIRIWRRMLKLDPADHLAARFFLVRAYLIEGQDDAAREEAIHLPEDFPPTWWTRTLIAFRLEGDGEQAVQLLVKALQANRIILEFLMGMRPVPEGDMPAYEELGGESEALNYLAHYAEIWAETTGAMGWLVMTLERYGRTGR